MSAEPSDLAASDVLTDGLHRLTARFDGEQWLVLGVLACERRVTPSLLQRLQPTGEVSSWLGQWASNGLVVDAGVVQGFAYARNLSGERAYSMSPTYRPLVMRHLAARGALRQVKDAASKLIGHGSCAGATVALYSGDLAQLRHEVAELLRCSVRGENETLLRGRLREAVCSPFDPDALARLWGEGARTLVEQVLVDASVAFESSEEPYRWALAQVRGDGEPRTLRILAEHAILRGDSAALGELRSRLPVTEVLALRSAEAFMCGDIAQSQRLLEELTSSKAPSKRSSPCPASVTALLTLLALSRQQPNGSALARRVLPRVAIHDETPIVGWPAVNAQLELVRALRSMMRSLARPEFESRRLSPHHLAPDAPGWQTLVTALTVLLDDCDATTRTAWARRLVDDAARWNRAGYDWIARQARHLAGVLSPEPHAEFETPRAGEPMLSLLLEREPDWRIALRAVDRLLQNLGRDAVTLARRVAWFIDMATGDLARPAIEEFRSGAGWSRGRRVDLSALREIQDTLPPEDRAVLTAIERAPLRTRFPPEAIEALCSHPRVFNGARGRQRVEVVRGTCRVQTERERGHLVIQLQPTAAAEGVHVVVESDTRVSVYRVDASFARLVQAFPSGIRVPESHQNEARAVLARLAEHVPIDSPELGACRTVAADSTPCLRISPEAGAWWVEIGVRPFGEFGRFFPPGLGRCVVIQHAEGELLDSARNFDQEIARYDELLAHCPTLRAAVRDEVQAADIDGQHAYGLSLDEEGLFSLLSELRESGLGCHLEWQNGRAIAARGRLTGATLNGALRRIKGWYLINGSVSLDEASRIELADLVRMPFTKSGRFVRLPSGDFLEVERRMGQVLTQLACVAQLPARGAGGELRVPEPAIDTLRTLVDAAGGLHVDPTVTEWCARIDDTLAGTPAVPPGLCATLRPYQVDGFRWLSRFSELGLGVCLADDMGLGKTVQVIALLLTRAGNGPALVVAPTSVCSNWLDELRRFAPSLRVAEYAGRARTKLLEHVREPNDPASVDVLVTSYALLQQDASELAAVDWNTAVLDEAQFVKNPGSLRAKAAFALTARYRVAMTGTPVENHLGDLWSIFHFLNPTLLGSLRHFQLAFLRPIERDHDPAPQALLKRMVQPFLLRRRKDQVLRELPAVTTLCHEVRLSEDEALRYALLRRQVHEKLTTPHGRRQHKLQILAEITRLRRFCCHPRLVFPDAPTESSKLQVFLDLAEELRDNGHRALVFSQFVDLLELLQAQLAERGFRYVYLDGSTPKEVRSARVQAFQTGDAELFLISLKAGGFGLNLTAADYVIHLDPWWNPATEAQATDRAHRIGQERPVTVYRLVTKDTIEEQIVALHQEKRTLAEALLQGAEGTQALSGEELLALLDWAG